VFNPLTAGKDVEGDVQDVVGLVIGRMPFEQMQVAVDLADQVNVLRQQCRSRLAREPFSRAKASQLSGCGIRIDHRNADAGVLAKIQSGLVQGQAAQSSPEIELVSLGPAIEATKEPPRQLYREAARDLALGGMKWACATKLVAMPGGGMIANQVEHAHHRNLVAQSSVIDQHRFWSDQVGRRLAVEAFADCLAGRARWAR
jgi:hypothetical protein